MPVVTRSQVKNLEKHVLSCKKNIHDGPVSTFKVERPRRQKAHYVSPDGDVYEGEMKNGKMDGKGKMIYANGDIYEGKWKWGFKWGKGKLISADDEDIEIGVWEKDTCVAGVWYNKFGNSTGCHWSKTGTSQHATPKDVPVLYSPYVN